MNKLLNLQTSFPSIYTSWKDKTPIISTEKVRMVANLATPFLQIQSIFFASKKKKKKRFLSSGDLDLAKRSSLYSEGLAKLSPRTQKLYQIICTFINPMWSLFNHFFYTIWHKQKPLGCSEFSEPNYFFKRYLYIVAYLRIILQASLHIPKGS